LLQVVAKIAPHTLREGERFFGLCFRSTDKKTVTFLKSDDISERVTVMSDSWLDSRARKSAA
jgi:hypothetical protein